MEQIPTDTHIRNLLDPLPAEAPWVLFRQVFQELAEAGTLERFKVAEGQLLLVLDGTEHFSSEKVCCPNCTRRVLKNGHVRYSHSVVTPVIVSPEQSEVVSLEPAFILPQDGEEKQDCEINAAKRWIEHQAPHYELEGTIVLGDDLYCHQPWCEANMNFILVCKPSLGALAPAPSGADLDSHKTLYEYLDLYPPEELQLRRWNGRYGEIWHYPKSQRSDRYANGLPLRDGEDALLVNWCELSIYREDTGELLFRKSALRSGYSFATNLPISADTVADVVAWGRCRFSRERGQQRLEDQGLSLRTQLRAWRGELIDAALDPAAVRLLVPHRPYGELRELCSDAPHL
jgi:hypothetical protein